MKKSWVLLVLAVVLSTLMIVNCARPVPQPPAPPTTPTAVGGVGQVVLNWNQVPGATGYQVQYQPLLGSGQRGWTTVDVAAPPYTLEEDPGNYEWQVRTKKGNLFSEWVNGPAFEVQEDPGPSDLTLTLSEVPERGVPTIFIVGTTNINYLLAQVTSTVPGLETVAYYVQKVGSQDQKRWPDSATTYELDDDGEHVFGINNLGANFTPNLAVGEYWFWVQGTGDQENIRSNKLRFDIAILGSGEIEIVKKIGDTEYEGKICAPEDAEVEVDYHVDFTFADNFSFLGWSVLFQANDPTTSDSESGEGKPEPMIFTVIYATECTKYATITLDATIASVYWDWDEGEVDDGELAIQIQKVISFILDMKPPTGTAAVETNPELEDDRITSATITFVASDTKCLQPYAEKISFEFNIYKGEGSWNEIIEWGEFGLILGEGSIWDNEVIASSISYATAKTDDMDQATATFVLEFGALDAATVTATMTVADCCVGCLDCCIPDDPCEEWDCDDEHMVKVGIEPFFIDNVFFSTLLDEDEVIQHDGFIEVEGREVPTVPASPTEAWFQLIFADANWDPDGDWDGAWDDIDDIEIDLIGPWADNLSFGFSATKTTGEVICAGYSTKIILILEATVTAYASDEPTETTVTFNATATDDADNEHFVTFTVFVDTMPPTLTYFRAFRNPDIDESKIEFRFHEEPFDVELVLSDGVEEFPLDFDDAYRIGSPNEFMYRLFPDITIQFDVEYTLYAKATDAAGNTGESEMSHEAAMASTR